MAHDIIQTQNSVVDDSINDSLSKTKTLLKKSSSFFDTIDVPVGVYQAKLTN